MGKKYLWLYKKIYPISINCKCCSCYSNFIRSSDYQTINIKTNSNAMGQFNYGYLRIISFSNITTNLRFIRKATTFKRLIHHICHYVQAYCWTSHLSNYYHNDFGVCWLKIHSIIRRFIWSRHILRSSIIQMAQWNNWWHYEKW